LVNEVDVVACSDVDLQLAKALASQYGIQGVYVDYSKMIEKENLDAVVVATPAHTHTEIAGEALRAGLDILLEKPIALTLKDARLLVELSERMRRILQVGHCLRFWPGYKEIKEIVDSGEVGEPVVARAHRWATSQPSWYKNVNLSGGVAVDMAIHDYDYIRWLMGDVRRVYAQGVLEGDTPVHVQAVLELSQKGLAYVDSSWLFPNTFDFSTHFEVVCRKGMLLYSSEKNIVQKIYLGSEKQQIALDASDAYVAQLRAFIRAVKNRATVHSAWEAYKALELSLAVNKSVSLAVPVELGGSQND
jgi:predicted dehydrogenase